MTSLQQARNLRTIFQYMYCQICTDWMREFYSHFQSYIADDYIEEKMRMVRRNPLSWYCELSDEYAQHFIELVAEKYPEILGGQD